jgi:hypothetical protein
MRLVSAMRSTIFAIALTVIVAVVVFWFLRPF